MISEFDLNTCKNLSKKRQILELEHLISTYFVGRSFAELALRSGSLRSHLQAGAFPFCLSAREILTVPLLEFLERAMVTETASAAVTHTHLCSCCFDLSLKQRKRKGASFHYPCRKPWASSSSQHMQSCRLFSIWTPNPDPKTPRIKLLRYLRLRAKQQNGGHKETSLVTRSPSFPPYSEGHPSLWGPWDSIWDPELHTQGTSLSLDPC